MNQISNNFWSKWLPVERGTILITKKQERTEKRQEKKIKKALKEA